MEKINNLLNVSLPIYKKWREVDVVMSKRSELDNYKKSVYDNAKAIIFAMYRMIESNTDEEPDKDVILAKQHINALIYESYSIAQSSLLKQIHKYTEIYDSETIKTVYPNYYSEYLTKILIIQNNLTKINEKKDTLAAFEGTEELENLKTDIFFLNDVILNFEHLKGSFEKKISEDKSKNNKDMIKQISYIIIAAILGVFLTKCADNFSNEKPESKINKIIKTDTNGIQKKN